MSETTQVSKVKTYTTRVSVIATASLGVLVLSTAGIAFARNPPTTLIGTASVDPGQDPDATAPTPVQAIAEANGRYYIAGDFTQVGGETQRFIAAIEVATGQLDTSFRPVVSGEVFSIALSPDGSDLYLGGLFSSVNGVTRNNIAKIDAITGELDTSFNPDASNTVETLAVGDDGIYAGGRFFRIGGAESPNLIKLNANTGQADPAWVGTTDGTVLDLELVGNNVYVGGNFQTAVGEPHQNLVRLTADTGSVHPNWNNSEGTPQRTQALSVSPDRQTVFVGTGGRSSLRGNTVFAYSNDGTLLWQRVADGDIQAIEATENELYLGTHGQFVFDEPRELLDGSPNPNFPQDGFANGGNNPNAIRREKLFSLDPATGELLPWDPHANSVNGVWEIESGPSGLLVGGDFTQILNPSGVTGSGGTVEATHVAVFSGIGGGNLAPEPQFEFSCDGDDCEFDASASFDDGSISSYSWDFGNGQTANGRTTEQSLANNQTHEVTLRLTDNTGQTAERTQLVAVGNGGTDVTTLGVATASGTNNGFTVELPDNVVNGDVAVAFVSVNTSEATASLPDGWVEIGDETNGNLRTFIFRRALDADDAGTSVEARLSAPVKADVQVATFRGVDPCLLYTSPSPRDLSTSRMPSSA